MDGWSPAAGVLVLLEPTTSGRADGLCLTGTVARPAPGPDAGLIIDLGGSPDLPRSPCEVAASFYAPDGFYRVEARAEELGDGEIVVSFAIEPDRLAERARTVLAVAVAAFDGHAFLPSMGETLDLSGTGCRVQVDDRLPAGAAGGRRAWGRAPARWSCRPRRARRSSAPRAGSTGWPSSTSTTTPAAASTAWPAAPADLSRGRRARPRPPARLHVGFVLALVDAVGRGLAGVDGVVGPVGLLGGLVAVDGRHAVGDVDERRDEHRGAGVGVPRQVSG